MSDPRRKRAFTVGVDTKGWEDSPGIIAGVPLVGAGAGALAAGGATELATRKLDLLEPGILDKAKQFKELPGMTGPPQDFLARYTDLGSSITRGPVLRDLEGNPWSGRKLVENIRSGDIGKILSSAGVVQGFDADSKRHYQEFEKGPAAAAREMYRETFADPAGQFKGDVLGRRYQAAKAILDRGEAPTAELMSQAFADDPFMSRFERQLAASNPEAYQRVFDVMREGGDPSALQNQLVDPLIGDDPLRGRVDEVLRGAGLTDEAFAELDGVQRRSLLRQMYSGTPVADWAAQRMGPVYRGNVGGYQRIIDPIIKGEGIRKAVQRGGRGLMGLGLLGLGAGALGVAQGVDELGDFQGVKIGAAQVAHSAGLVDFFKESGHGGTEIHAASTMVAIYPPPAVAEKIKPHASDKNKDTLHVTLVYLGHKTEGEAQRAASVIEECCRKHPSMELKVNGAGVFPNKDASVRQLLIGGVGLVELRSKIFEKLEEDGLVSTADQRHGFIPHMTLEYHSDKVLPDGWEEVGKLNLSWNCGEVRVVRGDKLISRVPLGGDHDFAPRVTGDERLRVDVKVKDEDGKVLAGNWPDNPDKKFLPGGGVEAGETVEEAGEREVAEETGWKVKNVRQSDEPDTIIPGESRTVWLEAKATGEKNDSRKGDDAGKFLRNVRFVDEGDVEKVAVTLQQLRKGVSALKERVPVHRRGLQMTDAGGATARRTGDDVIGPVGPAAMKPTDPEGLDAMLDEGLRHVDEVPARDNLYNMIREMNSETRGFPQRPQIFMGEQEPVKFVQSAMENDRLNRLVPQMSPAGREAFNRSVWLHEGAELGKQFGGRGFASHLSTRPMLQDLNIAATLEGPGEEAANALRLMREPEIEAIEAVVPGAERLGLGQNRLSRHAQKRLQEAYERNLAQTSNAAKVPQWEMIQGAFPRAKVAGDWDDPVEILEAMGIDAAELDAPLQRRARRKKLFDYYDLISPQGESSWPYDARREWNAHVSEVARAPDIPDDAWDARLAAQARAGVPFDASLRGLLPLSDARDSFRTLPTRGLLDEWRQKNLNHVRRPFEGAGGIANKSVARVDMLDDMKPYVQGKLQSADPAATESMRNKRLADALAAASQSEGASTGTRLPTYLHEQATSWADDLGMGDVLRKALTKKGSAEKVALNTRLIRRLQEAGEIPDRLDAETLMEALRTGDWEGLKQEGVLNSLPERAILENAQQMFSPAAAPWSASRPAAAWLSEPAALAERARQNYEELTQGAMAQELRQARQQALAGHPNAKVVTPRTVSDKGEVLESTDYDPDTRAFRGGSPFSTIEDSDTPRWVSAHPDVSLGYSAGQGFLDPTVPPSYRRGELAPRRLDERSSNRVFEYDLRNIPDAAQGPWTPQVATDTRDWTEAQARAARQTAGSSDWGASPTYEKVVSHGALAPALRRRYKPLPGGGMMELEDMTRTKQSSARKERDLELWRTWKRTKSQQDLTALLKQMDGAIQSEVNRWSGAIARPVLEAKAKRLALEAFESYDPNKGAALNTHLTHRLKKLSREVYTHQDAVRLPEYKKLKVHSYTRGYNELMGQHGREPTNAELQDHLGWSPKMVSSVQRGMMPELVESADVGGGLFERQSVWGSDSEDGLVDMFYYDLDPTDKLIFEHSTGYSGKKVLSNPEIMKKTNLTQGQLSYRKRKLVDRLKELQG